MKTTLHVLACACLFTVGSAWAQSPISGDGPWVVRAYFDDLATRDIITREFAPWDVNRRDGYLVIQVDATDLTFFANWNIQLTLDDHHQKALTRRRTPSPLQLAGIPGYPCYRTVEETYASAQQLVTEHPGLATWTDIGDSWEKSQNAANGYDIMALRLTNLSVAGPKPKFIMTAAIHAREYTTAELATRFAEYLVDNYGVDPDVTWLLDSQEVHFILQANPDGRKQAETQALWRKNTNDDYCSGTDSRGADLNRNFSFQWNCCGGSSSSACQDTYHGVGPGSDPETQAVQDYLRAQFPDQRPPDPNTPAPIDASGVYFDLHSYSELVLWPWGYTNSPPPNPGLATLGRRLAFYNDYDPQQAIELYVTDGTTDDFAYGDLGVAAYTFELGTAFFQDCSVFESSILPDNLQALIYAAKAARAPYQLAPGPVTLNPTPDQISVAPGDPVTLTALIDDSRFNQSNGVEPVQTISAAELTVDTPTWVIAAGSGTPMTASDGSFDGSAEMVEATLSTSGWSQGRHKVFVHGMDANGDWGLVGSTFVYVLDPATAPHLVGSVTDAGNGGDVSAQVHAGLFEAQAAAGHYDLVVAPGTYDLLLQADGYVDHLESGVLAQTNQTTQVDVSMIPLCVQMTQDGETGPAGWSADVPWALSDLDAHDGTFAWSDSPGGEYGNNLDIALTSPAVDLTGKSGARLVFWHHFELENRYDYGYVETSTDGGANWITARTFNGEQLAWEEVSVDLSAVDGSADARVRFRLRTDVSITRDGWTIDEIRLLAGDPLCNLGNSLNALYVAWPVSADVGNMVTFINAQ